MGTAPTGKAIDAQYLLDQLKNFDSKILANKYGITKTVKNDFTVYADGSSPDPDLKVRNGRVDLLKTDATDTVAAWSSLFTTKTELQSGDAAHVLSHKFYTKNFMINDAKNTILQYNASDNTFFIEKSNWCFNGGDNKDFIVSQANNIILEIGSGDGHLTIPCVTQAKGKGYDHACIYGPDLEQTLGFGEFAIGLGWKADGTGSYTDNFTEDSLKTGVILQPGGEARLRGASETNLQVGDKPVFESSANRTKMRVNSGTGDNRGFIQITKDTSGSNIYLTANTFSIGHGANNDSEIATMTYNHSKSLLSLNKDFATSSLHTDSIESETADAVIAVANTLAIDSSKEFYTNHIENADDGEQSAEITLEGGGSSAKVLLYAGGEENSAQLTMQGSSTTGDKIELNANNITFKIDGNTITMPKDKSGTIAIAGDSGSSVTYETDAVESTVDMKSIEDDEGGRHSKSACFGSFSTAVGKKIGMNSDGVYLYMPWDGSSQSYGHIIAGDDDDNGDASLYHTALSGDSDDDVPAFRRILDSVNFSDYVSTGYKGRSWGGCKIPTTGSETDVLNQYWQTMTGYHYIKVGNYVSMKLYIPRLKTGAGDAYGAYELPFTFKNAVATAIVPEPKYSRRTVLGDDCWAGTYCMEFSGKRLPLYAPESATSDELNDYGVSHSRGWTYSINYRTGWDTILLEGQIV